jgi:hypothetical protein
MCQAFELQKEALPVTSKSVVPNCAARSGSETMVFGPNTRDAGDIKSNGFMPRLYHP